MAITALHSIQNLVRDYARHHLGERTLKPTILGRQMPVYRFKIFHPTLKHSNNEVCVHNLNEVMIAHEQ